MRKWESRGSGKEEKCRRGEAAGARLLVLRNVVSEFDGRFEVLASILCLHFERKFPICKITDAL